MSYKKNLFCVVFFAFLFSFPSFSQLKARLVGNASDQGNDCFIITPSQNTKKGGVWYDNPINLDNDFEIYFQANFGVNDDNGADGMALVFKGDSTPVIGGVGKGVGYEGILTSLIVEFDTYQNDGDIREDHIAILKNGVADHTLGLDLVSPIQASSTSINIEDGQNHDIKIEWIAATQTFNVYFDCVLRATYTNDIKNTIFFGDNSIYFGFVGSTGGFNNLHQVCFNRISFVNNLVIQDQQICKGGSVTVDATVPSGTIYSWSPTTGVSNPNIANPVFSPSSTTTYSVTITDNCGETNSSTMNIVVTPIPIVDTLPDVTSCKNYTLPALTNGSYFSATNGGGISYSAGDIILSTTTLFVFNETTTNGVRCTNENSFTITINPLPLVDSPIDITSCNSYILPALTNGSYFSATNGGGISYSAGDIILSTTTLFVFNETTTNGVRCTNENSFTITINPLPLVDSPIDITSCNSYILPALTNGSYFSATNGGGTNFSAGDIILSTTTLFVFNETTTNGVRCTNENSFTITINPLPLVDSPIDITSCNSYILPALTNGSYFSATNGGGISYSAGDIILSTTTLFVFNETTTNGVRCTNENSFTITINPLPLVDSPIDITSCNSYTLPALTNGSYFSATNGGGTNFSAGDVITTTTTLFVFNEATTNGVRCINENSFTITIEKPEVDILADISSCENYTLPALTNGSYFSATNGGGISYSAGDIILSTTTLFVFNETTTNGVRCTNENSFTITINPLPLVDSPIDITSCNSYILPALTNGSYFSATNGGGTNFSAGDVITTTTTLFVFNEATTNGVRCINENSFTITIEKPEVDILADISSCENYTLPALTNGSYFSATNGGGISYSAGDIILSTTTLFVFNETTTNGVRCTNENSFTITINPLPLVDSPIDITSCNSYILPALTNGSYFSATNGGGTNFSAGDVITTTTTLFVFNEATTNGVRCINENSFTITIEKPEVDILADISSCENYTLPALTNGSYFSATNGGGISYSAGDIILSTTTLFVFNETTTNGVRCTNENSFTIIITSPTLLDVKPEIQILAVDEYYNHWIKIAVTSVRTEFFLYKIGNGDWQKSNIFNNVQGCDIVFSIKDTQNCQVLMSTFTLLNYPKFLTPNDDGINDTWNINCLKNQPDAIVRIFDRFGKFLMEFKPSNSLGWDGKYNGTLLSRNDYWFSIDYQSNELSVVFKNHFSLIR